MRSKTATCATFFVNQIQRTVLKREADFWNVPSGSFALHTLPIRTMYVSKAVKRQSAVWKTVVCSHRHNDLKNVMSIFRSGPRNKAATECLSCYLWSCSYRKCSALFKVLVSLLVLLKNAWWLSINPDQFYIQTWQMNSIARKLMKSKGYDWQQNRFER